MKQASKNGTKKGPGRPATGQGLQIGTRWPDETVAQIDRWANKQEDEPGRSEAIRRLVDLGLSVEPPQRPRVRSTAKQSAARAVELAGNAIDKHSDQGASDDERSTRKRKLIQGPSVFRDARKDRPSKGVK